MIRRLVTRYWLLLPLLILIVIIVDRVEQPSIVETEDTIDMRQTQSDYYLSEFNTRRFGLDGTVEYRIEGLTLAHYPDDDRSEITAPKLQLRRGDIDWKVRSNAGRYDPAPNLFTLNGEVTVTRTLQDSGATAITLTSESLRITTDSNLIETDDLIEITAPTWRLQSTGLRGAMDDAQLSLLSNVIGRYEVPDSTQNTDR